MKILSEKATIKTSLEMFLLCGLLCDPFHASPCRYGELQADESMIAAVNKGSLVVAVRISKVLL